jgi:DNA polymerase III delta prime subunit
MNYIWYEKYRPHFLEEMELPESVYKGLNRYIIDQDIPNLLFHGPPGGGKTTVAQILLDSISNQNLKLNASNDRSMEVMRDQVVRFAHSQPIPGSIKIVFMDEADGLLAASQNLLRGAIEKVSKHCRFIFTANYPNKLSEPIRSRFIPIKFDPVEKGTLLKHLAKILNSEKVKFSIKDLHTISDLYFPDVRTIINSLQLCSIDSALDLVHLQQLEDNLSALEVSNAITKGDLRKVRELVAGQHDFQGLYRHLFDTFIQSIPEEVRPNVAVTIAESMYRDNLCIDKEICFSAMVIEIIHILGIKKIEW